MRKLFSQQCLERSNWDLTAFVRSFFTMDEIWVHHQTPKNKTAVEAVGGSRWLTTKESEVNRIYQEGHGQCVLGCERDPVN
ncbi:hypothetical protein TNIN_168431 [Trichonephila inaurata madagascariensis]|uniref:Uncharacterized protein n=1 Tax=Trichonephila inaurata madagascariensis TaxID=2747483 RepID=A0A8X6XQL2_9ARAC|nr:hypothetical protein TNIN_168431 [Trichonephila inaurata madagascariensis]